MSNFNKIFAAVKKQCHEEGCINGNNHFEKIASEANVSLERLHFYLECLNDIGVIQYSSENKSILMTDKGKKAGRIFP